jgi:hypothetical protein
LVLHGDAVSPILPTVTAGSTTIERIERIRAEVFDLISATPGGCAAMDDLLAVANRLGCVQEHLRDARPDDQCVSTSGLAEGSRRASVHAGVARAQAARRLLEGARAPDRDPDSRAGNGKPRRRRSGRFAGAPAGSPAT